MPTRVLKLEDEDLELIQKLISNIHRRLLDDASHPVYSQHMMATHRLFKQLDDGLLTEREYVHALSAAKEAFETADEKSKARKQQARQRKLQKSGITATTETVEASEPLAEPKRTKVRKAATPKKRAAAKKEVVLKGPCSAHKDRYSGARSPRSDCGGCWRFYKELHPDRYGEAWKRFKSK